ncbi:MAG: PaaI family thioesterase [Myxococcales bacterium]|nr:PaaI family thioesterase [Myxococcales bacterium]
MSDTLDGRLFGEDQMCFGCGPNHPIGFRLSFAKEGDVAISRFTPGERFQGPPGIFHGGLVLTLADEVASWGVVLLLGRFGFTGRVEGSLKKAIRIGREVEARARIAEDRRRIVDVDVDLHQDGALCFDGRFRFMVMDEKGAERLLGGPLPEAWRRLARDGVA